MLNEKKSGRDLGREIKKKKKKTQEAFFCWKNRKKILKRR